MPRLLLLSCLLFLVGRLPAQAEDFGRLKKQFEKAAKKEELEVRTQALEILLRATDPEVVDVLVEAIVDLSDRIESTEQKAEKLDQKIKDEIYKRVEKPKVSPTQKRAAQEQTMEKLEPEFAKLKELRQLIDDDLSFKKWLEDAIPQSVENLDENGHETAATLVLKRIDRSKKGEALVHYARALGSIKHPLAKAALIENAANSLYPSVRVVCLDALCSFSDDESEAAGIRGLGDEFRQVRSAAIGLLRVVGSKTCIPPAIKILGTAEGATKSELRELLKWLTKFDFNDNPALWQRWFDENEAAFDGRGEYAGIPGHDRPLREKDGKKGQQAEAPGGTGFYGIETTSKNLVYILDVSGSMLNSLDGKVPQASRGERRIDLAVEELIRSIMSLPGDATFNIVFYETTVSVWRSGMQEASKANKEAARDWAKRVEPNGQTNIYDAIEKAFDFAGRGTFDKEYSVALDEIFLLTDGSANQGRYTAVDDMLAGVLRLNSLAKVVVHGIAIGGESGFLRQLSEQNRGKYVLVR